MHKWIYLLFPLYLFSDDSFEAFKRTQSENFQKEKITFIDYKKEEEKAFRAYQEQVAEAISLYRKEVEKFWPTGDLGDARRLVSYSKDLQTKSEIDFEKNQVLISTRSVKDKDTEKALFMQLDKTLKLTTQDSFANDALEQKISGLAAQSSYIQSSSLNKTPLLPEASLNVDNIRLTHEKNTYKLTYTLPKDANYRRSFHYLVPAKSNARRFNLRSEWLLAIMHSESSFNPLARSWVPAYGLMQIVPKTAGIDSYLFLYKKRRLLSASYLYNTENNIEIGSAYFHILYYKYLSSIKDPLSRLYCAIAGYNTGAGNVARAFVKSNSIKKASIRINSMSPKEVYNHLLNNLKYEETKHYLKRVVKRSEAYKKLYQL